MSFVCSSTSVSSCYSLLVVATTIWKRQSLSVAAIKQKHYLNGEIFPEVISIVLSG